ncbi:PAS domain-containing protein [Massilia suwonensis]|uniref:histidine kinase n=1 Tax=Massilia suwonensis TaxID=648895 RepID=A0ABW0MJT4_9BURK
MPPFRRTALPSIRSKLFTLVLASLLPLLFAYIAFVHDAGRREGEHVARDAATVTRALAAALDRDLESAETAARVAAAWPSLAPGSLERFHTEARRLLRPEFAVSNFALSGADARPLLDTRHAYGSALPEMPNRDSVEAVLLRGDARISGLYRPGPGQAFVFSADVPVWREGKVAYVLSSQVRPKRIADLLGAQQLPPGWIAEIFDGRGLVVARNIGGATRVGTPINGVLASNAAASPEGVAALPDEGDGVARHAAWMRSGQHGWLVAVTYPDNAARELLGNSLPATVAVGSAMLGLGLLLAWTIGGGIARSVQGLVGPAIALGRGEPLRLAPPAIGETFEVAAALQEVEGELLRYRSQLEARVADRTAELERLNVRLETVYATAPVGLCFVDRELRFVMINDYLAAINAVPALAHLGRTLPELLGEVGVEFEAPYRRVLETGRALRDLEVAGEVPAEPGVIRHWLSSYYPVFGPQRELVGINAVVIDITERKQLEQRNRDNEEMFRVLFEGSGDAQALLAYNAHFVSVNPAAARMFGYSVEELTLLAPASISPEFQPNGRRSDAYSTELMRRALDEGGIQFEWVNQRRNGSNFHADVKLTSIDIGGRGMLQATIRDISERVAADAALRASGAQLRQRERFIRTVTDNLPALVSYWDADERLRFANRPALAWLGTEDEAAVLGQPVGDLVPADILAQLRPYVAGVLAGRPQSFEEALRNPQGEPVHVWGSYLPDVDSAGRVRGFYALHADISALKLTEGRLVEALREAEQASRAKSEFLGNMSHEIRTPMNAIMGLARLLEEAPLGRRERAHLAHIKRASNALLGILNDLLDYAKTDAGQLVLEQTPLQLDAILQGIAVLTAPDARAKGIETVFKVAPDVPRLLRGDPVRLEQVLLNLVGNAVKFTDSGEILLSVEVAARSPGRVRLRFAVLDTGIGIAASEQARLFEPFSQGDSSTGRKYGGVGLGLSIARRLVALMGGVLAVDSSPGRGSTFHFEADFGDMEPAALSAPLAMPRALVFALSGNTEAALLAGLRGAGWEPVCVGDSSAAQAASSAGDCALLFADAAASGLDALPALPPTVLLVPDAAVEPPALPAAPRVALLGKPFTRTALEAAIREAQGTAAPEAPQPAPLEARLAGLRVLVVEDNAINQEVATYVLTHAGALVTVAADGAEALALLGGVDAAFDAVLMDLQMPVMNGYQATEAIRAMGLHALPVIAMSANSSMEDRRQAFDAGMDEHLAKPIDVDELVDTLARMTGRGGAARTEATMPAVVPRLPGLDLQAALPRFGGSLDAFAAVFARFVAGAGASFDELHALAASGERDAALVAAHRLRGVAANLGAVDLASQAQALESALRAGDDGAAARHLALLEPALAPLQAAARELAPSSAPAAPAQVDGASPAQLLELLRNNNLKALAAHAALAPGLAALLGASAAAELADAVGTLRFDRAAQLLGAILE